MSRFDGGWIKVHRKMSESDIGSDAILLAVWMKLLLWATWTETSVRWEQSQKRLPPGSVVTGVRDLAQALNLNKNQVHRALKYLEGTARISIEKRNFGSIVSIWNWELYQNCLDEPGHERDTNGTPTGHERDVIEEERKKNLNSVVSSKPLRIKKGDYSAGFEEVYDLYPRKEGKSPAWKIYQREITSPEIRDELIAAIRRYSKAKAGKDPEFIQLFSTFMNRWRDWCDPNAGKVQFKRESSGMVPQQPDWNEWLANQEGEEKNGTK